MSAKGQFKFRKHLTIGSPDAEQDEAFLTSCFIDTGDLATLRDCNDNRRLILGRTGTGKTALLKQLKRLAPQSIVVEPEQLSFSYLENSTILQFFLQAGVNLNNFFKLLWRHVFAVELLKARYGIQKGSDRPKLLERFRAVFENNAAKRRALDYLQSWGDSFWEDTEFRIREVTKKVEDQLKAELGTSGKLLKAGIAEAQKLSEQERTEIVQRGQPIINSIQLKALSDVLQFLDEDVFNDEYQQIYVMVDKLDESWVDDRFRYALIRSLIETVRDFLKVRHVKLCIVLRVDLIERVFRLTRDAGFQEEKYRSLFLPIRWTRERLADLVNVRVRHVLKSAHSSAPVSAAGLFAGSIEKEDPIDFIINRTLHRPRELIEFVNLGIAEAEGRNRITARMMKDAEGIYSKNRLRSLVDEWHGDYANLASVASKLLRKRPATFVLSSLNDSATHDACLEIALDRPQVSDLLWENVRAAAEGLGSIESMLSGVFHVFYRVGLVGLKTDTFEPMQWSHLGTSSIAADSIGMDTRVAIHPGFWRVFGIRPIRESGDELRTSSSVLPTHR